MAFPERIAELDRQIAAAVERAVDAVRAELKERIERASADFRRSLAEDLPAPTLPPSYLAAADLEPVAREAADQAAQSARDASLTELRDAVAAIDRARRQSDVLRALLAGARRHASRAAVFLVSPDGVRGWGASGFADDHKLEELSLSWTDDEAWRELRQGLGTVELTAADCARLLSQVEYSLPLGGALVPLVLRDRVAAAIYADRLDETAPWSLPALQTLTWGSALALETLPFRARAATPSLRSLAESGGGVGLDLWDPQAEVEVEVEEGVEAMVPAAPQAAPQLTSAEPAAPEPAAPEILAASEPVLAASAAPAEEIVEPPVVREEPWAAWEPEPAPEMPAPAGFSFTEVEVPLATTPEPPAASPEVEEDRAMAEEWLYEESVAAEPTPPVAFPFPAGQPAETIAFRPPAPVEEPGLELEPLPPLPSLAEAPPEPSALDMSEDETYLLSRDARPAVATPTPPPPPAAATSTQEVRAIEEDITRPGLPGAITAPVPQQIKPGWQSGGTTEVAPPPDLQGPGWAFATTRIPTMPAAPEDASHDEARRLARLLVSEIKLYNEEQVEDGRRNRDIYERLKEDIDRSRQMYEERVDERIRNTTDYFYQELVRILAGGDPKAMGI